MANSTFPQVTMRQNEVCNQPTCPQPTPLPAASIINTVLADVNAIIPNFSSLVSSYRLLVGAAEEIHRTPGVCPDVFERAVRRYDNTGTLIDILLDLLCCKIIYSSEFLRITCAPIDLFRLFTNRCDPCDLSHRTADQILTLEALRRGLADCLGGPCFPREPVVCPDAPPPGAAAPTPPASRPRLSASASETRDDRQISPLPLSTAQSSETKPPAEAEHTAISVSSSVNSAALEVDHEKMKKCLDDLQAQISSVTNEAPPGFRHKEAAAASPEPRSHIRRRHI